MAKKRIAFKMLDLRNAFYEAGDPRRRLERADSKMVHYDRNATANLSNVADIRYFPNRPWNGEDE